MRVAVVVALAFLSGCGRGDQRRVLLVYSPHGVDILQEFEEGFERAHPDVNVSTVYLPAVAAFSRIRGEKANPQAQVWWGGPSTDFDLAAKEGLLDRYVPTYADSGVPAHPDYAWTACFHFPVVLGYQPERVKREDLPKTFADLAGEAWHKRIVLRNPVEAGTLRTFIGAMVQRAVASGGTEDDGFKLLEGIARNVESYPASPDLMFEALEKGPRAAVTIWGLTDLVFQRQQKGYTFRAAGLDEPVPVLVDCIALVRGAGSDSDARAFYEFVNTPEAMASLARKHCRIPARPDFDRALLNEEIRAVSWTPMKLDLGELAQKIPAWVTRFETISRSVR